MIFYKLYPQISSTDKFVLKAAVVKRMASVYRCSRDNRAKQEERRGEIWYGRKGRGVSRRRLAGRLVEREGKKGRKKQKKKKAEVRKETAR